MRRATLLVSLSLVAAAGPAVAQSSTQPQQQPPERMAAPREPGLNLRLDAADLHSLSRNAPGAREPSGDQSAGGLPSLGGDARPLEPAPRPATRLPYPQNTNPGQ